MADFKRELGNFAKTKLELDGLHVEYDQAIEAALSELNGLWSEEQIILPRAMSIRALEKDALVLIP